MKIKHVLYAVELSDGGVKVGITSQPRQRLISIAWNLRQRGIRIVRSHVGAILTNCYGYDAERDVHWRIRKLASTVRGREWFYGISFNAAAMLINQITRSSNTNHYSPPRYVPGRTRPCYACTR